jgi:hypothetical protein
LFKQEIFVHDLFSSDYANMANGTGVPGRYTMVGTHVIGRDRFIGGLFGRGLADVPA